MQKGSGAYFPGRGYQRPRRVRQRHDFAVVAQLCDEPT
jgi:hypothetical protein